MAISVTQYLRENRQALRLISREFGKIAATVHASQMERIFEKGKGSDNLQIGQYSTSYKGVKVRKGRGAGKNTAFVNLQLTQQFKNDWTNSLKKRSGGLRWVSNVSRGENSVKFSKLSAQYGPFHWFTKNEDNLQDQLVSKMRKTLEI